ncbi:polyphosphate polymerase domain-containing protein [Hominifimenecus sp. rT4P-3]|uniref:polyphosphate polymerase domain-containing protein n=1 Tax=Hominifimenecus sp. rT4P-3 TaxID=3242979 RepID=UPI003DA46534
MKYRHEWKHEIEPRDLLILRQRLLAVARQDPHAANGTYEIRSLYFDNAKDKALREKVDGVNRREKFRIRYYNGDTSFLKLEKKSKIDGLCRKDSEVLQKEQVQSVIDQDYGWMMQSGIPLVEELYTKIIGQGLRPKTIVEYTREPFLFSPGNVRVTLDYHIRMGMNGKDFLNPSSVTIPARNAPIILEVKWDEFLPDLIRDALQLGNCRVGAFSKYAACRIYG